MQAIPQQRISAEINVTPMIDVLLTVFIIYLLIIILGRQVIRVQLPAPGSGLAARAMPIIIELPDQGGVRINGTMVGVNELDMVLRELATDHPASYALIDPGRERTYEEVIQVIDRARGAGIALIGFKAAEGAHSVP